MAEVHKSMQCWHSIRHIPEQAYSRLTDGRKVNHICAARRTLVIQLAGCANPDGTGITVSVEKLSADIGWKRRKLLYFLDDIEEMGLLVNGKLTGWNGTRVRALNIPAILALVEVPNSPDVEVHHSLSSSAPLEATSSAPLASLEVHHSLSSSAPLEADPSPNPPMVHTTVHPTANLPPTYPPKADGGQDVRKPVAAMSIEEFKKLLPETMAVAPIFGEGKRLKMLIASDDNPAIPAAMVAMWLEVRNIKGLPDYLWKFCLDECEGYRARALESTPEGRAAKQRQQEANEAASEALARINNPAAYGIGLPDRPEQTPDETGAMLRELCK